MENIILNHVFCFRTFALIDLAAGSFLKCPTGCFLEIESPGFDAC